MFSAVSTRTPGTGTGPTGGSAPDSPQIFSDLSSDEQKITPRIISGATSLLSPLMVTFEGFWRSACGSVTLEREDARVPAEWSATCLNFLKQRRETRRGGALRATLCDVARRGRARRRDETLQKTPFF